MTFVGNKDTGPAFGVKNALNSDTNQAAAGRKFDEDRMGVEPSEPWMFFFLVDFGEFTHGFSHGT